MRDPEDPLVAVLYVPGGSGPAIPVGATVDLSVQSVPRQQFGMLRGRVTEVGRAPLTQAQIAGFLGDGGLAEQFSRHGGPVAVVVRLERSASTTSGYRWSSADGPPYAVDSRTPVSGAVHLAAQRPVDWFTGVVLTFEPGDGFRRGGRRPGVLGAMPARLRGTSGTIAAAVVSSLLLVAVGASVPALSRTYIDMFLIGQQTSLLGVLFASMAVALVLTATLTALQHTNLLRGRVISSTLGSARFFRHLLRLPVAFYAQRNPADLVQRLQSNDAVAETLARDLSAAGVDAVVVVLYAVLLWTYDPQLTLVGVAVALLNAVALRIAIRLRATGTRKLRAESARLTDTSYGGLQPIETMKATGSENGFFRRWAGQHAVTLDVQQRLGVPGAWLAIVAPTLAALNSALILTIGGLRAVEGHLTVGLLVAFQALVTSFTAPVSRLGGVAGRIQDFAADVARLGDVENFPVDPVYARREPAASTRRLKGHVELDGITFGYSPLDPPLLEDFSLAVGPGQQVALVGGSGSGKSTVSRLISGLHTPWAGAVRIDGMRLEDIPRGALAASVSFVDQDVFLDEATSALDNEAQRVVIESTRALRTTRLVIAHRLSTVMDADRVIAMADGRIVQQGPRPNSSPTRRASSTPWSAANCTDGPGSASGDLLRTRRVARGGGRACGVGGVAAQPEAQGAADDGEQEQQQRHRPHLHRVDDGTRQGRERHPADHRGAIT
ncbi:ABC transporter transmembrane domain-containing protein [Streptomyces erythrochromogenes]|uniref:ABC transporter transmembrane domain-containing protein n=1 Tax=Streptomyces erythrochromogenes TaxID=285574 RepID=UPI0037F21064